MVADTSQRLRMERVVKGLAGAIVLAALLSGGTVQSSAPTAESLGQAGNATGQTQTSQWVVTLQPTDVRVDASGRRTNTLGPDIPVNAAHVLDTLRRHKLLPLTTVSIKPGETVCTVAISRINYPGHCSSALLRLLERLNGGRNLSRLQPDATIRLPDVEFENSSLTKVYAADSVVDQAKKRDDMKVAASFKRDEKQLSDKFEAVTFEQYRLRFSTSTPMNGRFFEQLLSRPGIFIVSDTRPAAKVPYFSAQGPPAPADHFTELCSGRAAAGVEAPYAMLLGSDAALDIPPCQGNRCPDVLLIDRPVAANPEIAPAIVEPQVTPAADAAITCLPPGQWSQRAHHGTHLAGLVASVSNGRAFAGVHPGARIMSRDWEELGQLGAVDLLQSRIGKPRRQIVLFASAWDIPPPWAEGSLLKKAEYRLKDQLAKAVGDASNILWVVAAGHAEGAGPNDLGLQVPDLYNRSPINLGDLRNVVVVTGCTNCKSNASLWPRGNYSPRYVHVAAPAEPIPSTATASEFILAGGTSQAAALVAGLASALITRWPDYYVDPASVKQRLQFTARPALTREDDVRISGGIVDATVAMLDPGLDYANTTRDQSDRLQPLDLVGWCGDAFTMGRVEGNRYRLHDHHAEVRTRDVFRIMRNPDPNSPRSWMVFKEPAWDRGEAAPGVVIKIAPGIPKIADASPAGGQPLLNVITSQPLLKTKTGVIRIGEIEDLLVRKGELPVVASCQ